LGGAAHDLQSKGRAVHRSGRREVILPARPVLLYEKRLQIEIDSCLVALDGIGRAACQRGEQAEHHGGPATDSAAHSESTVASEASALRASYCTARNPQRLAACTFSGRSSMKRHSRPPISLSR